MINSDIRDHAYQFFIEEAPELLGTIENTLLDLRHERTAGQVHEIMRAAHSLKGGAASVDLPAIKEIAHRLEDIFKALYSDAVVVDETMEGLLLESFDCLKDALMTQIDTGDLDHDGALEKALPLIAAIEEQLGDHLAAGEQFLPSSADLGVDIVSSLFEVDIVQGLEQIALAQSSGDAQRLRETLQGQTEVFAGLAEILNLTGFKEITDAVQRGLAQPETDIFHLADLALADWQNSCDQVLQNGDRQRGGEPSQALLDLAAGVGGETLGNNGTDAFAGFGEMTDLGNVFGGFGDLSPGQGEEFAAMEFPSLDGETEEDNVFAGMEFPSLDETLVEIAEDNVFAGMEFPDLAETEEGESIPLSDRLPSFAPETVNMDEPPYQFFIEEAPELLQTIENGLLTIRQDRSAAQVHGIMRAAHSLKGGAASVGLHGIKDIAHRLEDIFKALYSDEVVIDETIETLLLQAFDGLRNPLEQQIDHGYYDPAQAWQSAQFSIQAIEVHLGDRLGAGADFMPSSADLGVDIVSSLFEVDIAKGIEVVRQTLTRGDENELREVLTSQAEIFLGLGEILNLPGFKAICEAVQKALEVNPDQLTEITTLALADWQNSCDQVLQNGDRQRGGEPSALLLTLGKKEEKEVIAQPQAGAPKVLADLFFGDDSDEEEEVSPTPESEAPIILEIPEIVEAPMALPGEDLADFLTMAEALTETETPVEEPSPVGPSLEDVFGGLTPDNAQTSPAPLADFSQVTAESVAAEADLLAMVEAVSQSFEQLPAADSLPTPPEAGGISRALGIAPSSPPALDPSPLPPPSERKNDRRATPRDKNPANLSIRVDFQRLERMNNWVGELAINRNSLSLQNEQLQGSVRSLLGRFSQFQTMTQKLREMADHLVIAPDAQGTLRARRQTMDWANGTFDSLEMDSYGALSGQLQEILEEMMQLEEAVDDIVLFARASNQSLDSQKQMLFSLRDELMWARMLPLGEILNRFPRMLRDMSTKFKKPVQLKVQGTAVLVDRLALEKLNDPLMHLLRNAFDHGIESPVERLAAGKPETGTIEIHAHHQGNQTIIEIRDDGGGLKPEKILQRALERGLVTEEQARRLTTEQIHNLIFEPNFSTADQVSELSGRGVGLDVVRQQLQALKGNIVVSSRPGRGSVFSLRLPLTLTIAKLLVCLVGQSTSSLTAIAIPSDSVGDLLVPQPDQIKTSGGQRFLYWQQLTIPIYPLHQLLPYQCPLSERQGSKLFTAVPQPDNWNLPLILLRLGDQYCALEVNRLVTEQELVIKPFSSVLQAPSYLYGSTILADGTLIPVVNGALLLEWHWQQGSDNWAANLDFDPTDLDGEIDAGAPRSGSLRAQPHASTILVVDDSAALRRTLAFTLEKSGYRVLQAKDGQEALKTLGQTNDINLIICDVEMPNLNGFEFLGQRRRHPDMLQIPVAMLTSRGSDKHRQLAMTLGANAYFTKPYIEQQFLLAVKDLLAGKLVTV